MICQQIELLICWCGTAFSESAAEGGRDLRSRVNFLRQKQTRYVQVEPFMTPAQAQTVRSTLPKFRSAAGCFVTLNETLGDGNSLD
jgi:hypothetical protein